MDTQLIFNPTNVHLLPSEHGSLIYHLPTGNLYEQDLLSTEIIGLFRAEHCRAREEIHRHLDDRFATSQVDEALSELASINILENRKQPVRTPTSVESHLSTLVLHVNSGCNLECTYCYKEDVTTPVDGRKMSFETARDAFDFLLASSADMKQYNVTFFGGEPLTNLPLIKQVVEYSEAQCAANDKRVNFSLTTNGTLLRDPVIMYLKKHHFGITVSIDGPRAVHDRNRLTTGGQGSYDSVVYRVTRLLQDNPTRPVGARVTLCHGNTDVVGVWDHLVNDLGFHEVGFAPVTAEYASETGLSDEELIEVFRNMEVLGEQYITAALNNRTIGFSNLHRLLLDIQMGRTKQLPCGAGTDLLSVDANGEINLCHRFAGSDFPTFGDLKNGVDQLALTEFLGRRLDRSNTECETCRVRNLCSGGCYHESYVRYADPLKPCYHYCELLRNWIDFGLQAYARINWVNPRFFATQPLSVRSC